jgi:hypothetical protein
VTVPETPSPAQVVADAIRDAMGPDAVAYIGDHRPKLADTIQSVAPGVPYLPQNLANRATSRPELNYPLVCGIFFCPW